MFLTDVNLILNITNVSVDL